jgi:hypothetical protein
MVNCYNSNENSAIVMSRLSLAAASHDIEIHDMQQAHIAARAKQHGVRTLPPSLSTANLPDAAPGGGLTKQP